MADTPEARVKKVIKKILAGHLLYYNMPVPSGYGEPMLDFVGCHQGRFFAIEAKAPGELPTPRQRETIRKMREGGAKVFLIDCTWRGFHEEDWFDSLDDLSRWLHQL